MFNELKSVSFIQPLPAVLKDIRQALAPYLAPHPPRQPRPTPIVLVGGGSGSAVVGRALLAAGMPELTLMANVADTLRDKTTRRPVGPGILKQDYGIPDVVDLTKQLLHTVPPAKRTPLHAFLEEKPSEAMRIGYLVVAALYQELGDLQAAIQVLTEALGNSYEVLAVAGTLTEVYFRGAHSDKFLDLYTFAQVDQGPPVELKLDPPADILPLSARALGSVKRIIFGPGDLHFSVFPHFLVRGFREALTASPARLTIVANLTTREIDTPGFTLRKLLDAYDRYLPPSRICDVLVHQGSMHMPNKLGDDIAATTYGRFQLIRADVASTNINNNKQYMHDESKLGVALLNLSSSGQS